MRYRIIVAQLLQEDHGLEVKAPTKEAAEAIALDEVQTGLRGLEIWRKSDAFDDFEVIYIEEL